MQDKNPDFLGAVPGVETALPAFIGYTATAADPISGASLCGQPIRIDSLSDYRAFFGAPADAPSALGDAIALYYANGGCSAVILSVGSDGKVDLAALQAGLDRIGREEGPALILAPDALRLPRDDYYLFARAMIGQGARLGDRMAILDVHGGDDPAGWTREGVQALLADFHEGIAPVGDGRSYGAAYFPFLKTGLAGDPAAAPSGAMAGIYSQVDFSKGVWNAPANVGLASVDDVTYRLSDDEQADMNVPPDGLAVNAIRCFTGMGVLPWGARTLDGNSQDYRYVSVRRTLIYVEQSLKLGVRSFASAPNDASSWAAVKAMAAAFLTGLWKEGGLAGARPSDAFSVDCGLGATMTAEDILNGIMKVTVLIAVSHPAEFTMIGFQQQMGQPG